MPPQLRRWMVSRAPVIGRRMLLAAAALSAIGTVAWVASRVMFLADAERTTGTVVALREDQRKPVSTFEEPEGVTFTPIVTFRDERGREHRFASAGGSNPPSQDVGEQVEVVYDPDDPADAELAGFWSLWLGPLLLGTLTLAMLGGAAIFRRLERAVWE